MRGLVNPDAPNQVANDFRNWHKRQYALNSGMGFRVALEIGDELRQRLKREMETSSGSTPRLDAKETIATQSSDNSAATNTTIGRDKKGNETAVSALKNAKPLASDLAKANRLFHDAYGDEIKRIALLRDKSKLVKSSELAKELFELSSEEKDPTGKFVLLDNAIHFAINSGDPELTELYISEIDRQFDVDSVTYWREAFFAWADQVEAFFRGEERSAKQIALAKLILSLSERPDVQNQIELVSELLELALTQLGRNSDLYRDVKERAKKAETRVVRQEQMRVIKQELEKTNDPVNSTTLGKYLCFELERWSEGLLYLTNGEDQELNRAAKLELQSKGSFESRLQVANTWLALMDKLKEDEQTVLAKRLLKAYQELFVESSGLEKKNIEKKVAALTQIMGRGGYLQQSLLFYLPFDNSLSNLGQTVRQVSAKGDVKFVADRFGRQGGAIQFAPRSCVEILQDDSLFPFKNGEPLTYSMWVRSPAKISQIVASKYGPYQSGEANNHFYLAVCSEMISAWGTGQVQGPKKSGFAIDIENKPGWCSEWSHFVFVFNPPESTGSVFCNGILVHEGKMRFNEKDSSPIPLRFGRLPYDSQGNEITQMDDVRIFDRELSAAEVLALYKSEK